MNALVRALERSSLVFLLVALVASLATISLGSAWSAAVLKLFVAIAFTAWLLAAAGRGFLVLPRPRLVIAAAAFVALVIVSALASEHATSWRSAVTMVTPTMGFLVAGGLLSSDRLRRTKWNLLAVVVVTLGTYGLLQSLGLQLTPRASGAQRIWISSVFYHYSHYSGFLALVTPAALSIGLFARTSRLRTAALLISLLLLLNLALTWSWDVIAVTLAVCVVLLGIWVVRQPRAWAPRARLAVVGLLCMVALASVSFVRGADDRPTYLDTFTDVVGHLRNRLEGRWDLYRMVVRLPLERPLLGSGPGTFAAAFPSVRTEEPHLRPFLLRDVNYAHNDLLQVASEAGVPATLAFAVFWLLVVFTPSPRADFAERTALRAAVVCLLLCGLLDANLTVVPPTALLAWVAAGILHAPQLKRGPVGKPTKPRQIRQSLIEG